MCFFVDPSPVRRVPIPTGIQRKLNFVSVRTIKGSSSSKRGGRLERMGPRDGGVVGEGGEEPGRSARAFIANREA